MTQRFRLAAVLAVVSFSALDFWQYRTAPNAANLIAASPLSASQPVRLNSHLIDQAGVIPAGDIAI